MTDKLQEFIENMHANGIGPAQPHQIIADDTRRRYQVEGDRARTANGEYCLRIDADGFAVGWFKSYKTQPDAVSWSSKSKKRMSAEDKAEHTRRLEADKARRVAEDAQAREKARVEIARIWSEGRDEAGHGYLVRKGLVDWTARQWMDFDRMDEALLVPAMRGDDMVGLQKVYADGGKYFVPGSDLDGSWCWIGADDGQQVAVCEGYATGVSVHLATGWRVAVAFNAGNLVKVARAIGAGVVVCADEDLHTWHPKHRANMPEELPPPDAEEWNDWREKGWLLNTGREAGMSAAAAVGGARVLYPVDGGDWNDVHMALGLDVVRDRLLGAVAKAAPAVEEWEPDYPEYEDDVGPSYEDIHPLHSIKPLGYNKGTFYFFPAACGQIMEYSATALAQPANLAAMADWEFWERNYNLDGKMSPKSIAHNAAVELMKQCRSKRIFNLDSLRGVGVWRDRGRVVVNTGTELHVDGQKMKPQDFDGEAVYEAGSEAFQMGAEPLLNKEAAELRSICKMFNFRDPMMGELLAGSIVLGPISGVLDWRPHWILTGEAGSGKSTLMDNVVKPMIGRIGIFYNGASSEAGIRKKIGLSARPVVMDEFEAETKRAKDNSDAIMSLARDSSSGASRTNAVADVTIRSCFFLAAINPRITQTPDKQRFSTLELLKDSSDGAQARWKALELKIHEVVTPEYSRRMFARTLTNIDTLLTNIRVFSLVAARVLGSARAGDQMGALLAASFSLTSTRLVDEAFAESWMDKQNWSFHDSSADMPENEKFMATLLTLRMRYDTNGQPRESTIGSLIRAANDKGHPMYVESVIALKDIGIRVVGDRLVVANVSPNLLKLMRDTIWTDWRRVLMLFEGADNFENRTASFGTVKSKATSIPLHYVIGTDDSVDMGMQLEEVQW